MRVYAGCVNGNEATAFADPDNEVKVQQALGRLAQDRTVIMIAHRLTTVLGADRIFVLQEGRIAEQGNGQALAAQDGLFARLLRDYESSVQWKVEKEA